MTEHRRTLIAVILGLAGAVAAVSTAFTGTPRRIGLGVAVAIVAATLVMTVWPTRDVLPWWKRRELKTYRERLRERDGWSPIHMPTLGGTLVGATGPHNAPVPGFLCEVHAPNGVFFGLTEEAQRIVDRAVTPWQGPTLVSDLALPRAETGVHLRFPIDFSTVEGGKPSEIVGVPRGDYYFLWFGFERADESGSVRKVFLTQGTFSIGLAGIEQSAEP